MGCGASSNNEKPRDRKRKDEYTDSEDAASEQERQPKGKKEGRPPRETKVEIAEEKNDHPKPVPVPVDQKQLDIVLANWRLLKSELSLQQIGERFYEIEFDGNPELKYTIFHGVNMERQAAKLMLMIDAAMEYLEEKDKFEYILEDLGKRHGGFGVEVKHYDMVGLHLLTLLKVVLEERQKKTLEADGATPLEIANAPSPFTQEMYDAWATVYGKMRDAMISGLTTDMGNWWLLEYKKKEVQESVRRVQGYWGRFKTAKLKDYSALKEANEEKGATESPVDADQNGPYASLLSAGAKEGQDDPSALDVIFEAFLYPTLQESIRDMSNQNTRKENVTGATQSTYYPSTSSALPRSHRYAMVTDGEEVSDKISAERAHAAHDGNHHDHLPVAMETLVKGAAPPVKADAEDAKTDEGGEDGSDEKKNADEENKKNTMNTETVMSKAKAKQLIVLLDTAVSKLSQDMTVAEREIKSFGRKFARACSVVEPADATAEASEANVAGSVPVPLAVSLFKAMVLLTLDRKQTPESPFTGQHTYAWVWFLDLAAETSRRASTIRP